MAMVWIVFGDAAEIARYDGDRRPEPNSAMEIQS